MPAVKFVGVEDPADGTSEIHIDDVVLQLDGDAQELSAKQVARVKADFPGLKLRAAGDGAKASAAAQAKADELGVDVSKVEGTGSGGAVKVDDVVTAAQSDEDEQAVSD